MVPHRGGRPAHASANPVPWRPACPFPLTQVRSVQSPAARADPLLPRPFSVTPFVLSPTGAPAGRNSRPLGLWRVQAGLRRDSSFRGAACAPDSSERLAHPLAAERTSGIVGSSAWPRGPQGAPGPPRRAAATRAWAPHHDACQGAVIHRAVSRAAPLILRLPGGAPRRTVAVAAAPRAQHPRLRAAGRARDQQEPSRARPAPRAAHVPHTPHAPRAAAHAARTHPHHFRSREPQPAETSDGTLAPAPHAQSGAKGPGRALGTGPRRPHPQAQPLLFVPLHPGGRVTCGGHIMSRRYWAGGCGRQAPHSTCPQEGLAGRVTPATVPLFTPRGRRARRGPCGPGGPWPRTHPRCRGARKRVYPGPFSFFFLLCFWPRITI